MYRTRISGFSLVELLVAMVIGLIGSIIIFQVYAGFEGQRRVTTGGGDAATNLAAATNALLQAGHDAGYGLNFSTHLGCAAIGWQEYADPAVVPHVAGKIFRTRLEPVSIVRAPTGELLSLSFTRNSNDNSYSVTKLMSPMLDPVAPGGPPTAASTEAPLCLENMFGINKGDVLVLSEHKATDTGVKSKKFTCAVIQVRNIRADPACKNPVIEHDYGSYTSSDPAVAGTFYTYFNKPGGLGTIPDSGASGADLISLTPAPPLSWLIDSPVSDAPKLFTYKAQASVMNVGPAKGKFGLGLQTTTFTLQNGQLLESNFPLVDGIVFMDAQFGSASTPSATAPTLTYSKVLPENPANDPKIAQDTWFSLRTVRVVLITKSSQPDKDYNSPATLTAWSADGPGLQSTYTIPPADRMYRHKIVELVIPLRNMFWRP